MENDGGSGKKYERTTQEQLQYFVAFSKQYPDILKSSYGKGHMQNLWISLAENLNNMRGPTRSADKWKECLKNRINQIRCRARKSMLGWNNRKACTSKNKEMDEHDNLENTIEDLSDANTSNMMQSPTPHLSTIHPDRLFSCDENLQSPNDDGNVTIDLDSDSNHSNHSDVSNSYLFNFCERTNANLISMDEREHKSITQDDFKLLTEFKHHQTPGSASAPRSLKKDWNECIAERRNQFASKESHRELEQEAFSVLNILGLIENDKQPSLIDYRHRNTLNVEPYLKEEPTDNDETVNPTHDNSEIPDTREYPKRFDNHAFSEPLSEDFIELIRETLKRREEREERAILQQEQITNVLLLLNTNLEKMSDLLEKFTDKLDKL